MLKILALAAVVAASAAPTPRSIPVIIGGEPELDACTTLAAIRPQGAALRSGPNESFQEAMELPHGEFVHLCESSPDGQWSGVVLAQDGILNCGVSSPVPKARPYTGPCISGWILSSALELVAG